MSSSSSSSSTVSPHRTLLSTISCLLADIDEIVDQLENRFHHSDVSKMVDMVDELIDAVDLVVESLDVLPDSLNLVSSQAEEDQEC